MSREHAPDHRGGHTSRTHDDLADIDKTPPLMAVGHELSLDVPANTTRNDPATKTSEVPYDGWVTRVYLAWQNGSNNTTGVNFGKKTGRVFLPANDDESYIAFPGGGGAIPFDVVFPVREGEPLQSQFINVDTSNSHFVNVVPIIQEADIGGGS